MIYYDTSEQREVRSELISLYESYGAKTQEMNFAGLMTMFSVLEVSSAKVRKVAYVVASTVKGYHPDGTKVLPIRESFENATSSLSVNDWVAEKAIKGMWCK